jgi:hypothetical protein
MNRPRHGPIEDGAHFLVVHGDAGGGDQMAEIGHFSSVVGTLGFLHGELVLRQFGHHTKLMWRRCFNHNGL